MVSKEEEIEKKKHLAKILGDFKERLRIFDGFTIPNENMADHVRKIRTLHIRAQRTASTSIHKLLGGDSRHIGARVWKDVLGHEWDSIFKFGIRRNPYTRFVSAYRAFHKDPRDINTYLKEGGLEWLMRVRFFPLLPQYMFFCDKKGKIILDYLGRFENLDKEWEYISGKIGIDEKLPHIGKTEKAELTRESKNMIYPFYKKDFKLFGYKK